MSRGGSSLRAGSLICADGACRLQRWRAPGVPPAHISRDALSLVGDFVLRRRRMEAKLVLANTLAALDRTLLRTVALGWAWFEEIKAGAAMQAIADREGVTQRRVAHLLDRAFLAPDIVRSIVEGRQPPTLTAPTVSSSQGIECSGLISGPGSRRSESPLFSAESSLLRVDEIRVNPRKIPVKGLREIADTSIQDQPKAAKTLATTTRLANGFSAAGHAAQCWRGPSHTDRRS
jgi:hypothetical protein